MHLYIVASFQTTIVVADIRELQYLSDLLVWHKNKEDFQNDTELALNAKVADQLRAHFVMISKGLPF